MNVKLWVFVFSIPVLISFVLIVLQYGPRFREQKPNILFILVDNLGWNDVGYHNSDFETPTLDDLAEDGVKLENYYVQPSSTASISQLLTGKYQIYTGLQHGDILHGQPHGLPLGETTLAEKLRSSGYSTHMVGKWHLGFHTYDFLPTNRGFDSFYGILGNGDNQVKCAKFRGSSQDICGVHLYNGTEPVLDVAEEQLHTIYKQEVDNILTQRDSQKPMFMYVSLHPEKPNVNVNPGDKSQLFERKYSQQRFKTPRELQAESVAKIDDLIWNITEAFRSHGLWENTILVFSSDSGGDLKIGANNWPLRGGKGTHWDGAMRGVGFVHSPLLSREAFTTGDENYELMHISDWYPTLLYLAGVNTQGSNTSINGYNQWSSIKYKSSSPRKEILHNIDPKTPLLGESLYTDTFDNRVTAAIRSGHWKLITGYAGSGSSYPPPHLVNDVMSNGYGLIESAYNNLRLYNISADPTEYHEVSEQYPQVVRELLEKLAQYQENSVPALYPPLDIAGFPDLHNGVWEPWMV